MTPTEHHPANAFAALVAALRAQRDATFLVLPGRSLHEIGATS